MDRREVGSVDLLTCCHHCLLSTGAQERNEVKVLNSDKVHRVHSIRQIQAGSHLNTRATNFNFKKIYRTLSNTNYMLVLDFCRNCVMFLEMIMIYGNNI